MDMARIKYEITGGNLTVPQKGEIIIPPETSIRKDIEIGDFVIKTEIIPSKVKAAILKAKTEGRWEIDVNEKEISNNKDTAKDNR